MQILVQLADFLLKAAAAYVQTPEGQKELDDIESAVGSVVGDIFAADSMQPEQASATAYRPANQEPRDFKKPNWR